MYTSIYVHGSIVDTYSFIRISVCIYWIVYYLYFSCVSTYSLGSFLIGRVAFLFCRRKDPIACPFSQACRVNDSSFGLIHTTVDDDCIVHTEKSSPYLLEKDVQEYALDLVQLQVVFHVTYFYLS
jgi:hypothetical protein